MLTLRCAGFADRAHLVVARARTAAEWAVNAKPLPLEDFAQVTVGKSDITFHNLIYTFIYWFIYWFIYSFIYSFICLFIYLFICLFVYLFIYCFAFIFVIFANLFRSFLCAPPGVLLNPATCYRAVDIGPPADNETEAHSYRSECHQQHFLFIPLLHTHIYTQYTSPINTQHTTHTTQVILGQQGRAAALPGRLDLRGCRVGHAALARRAGAQQDRPASVGKARQYRDCRWGGEKKSWGRRKNIDDFALTFFFVLSFGSQHSTFTLHSLLASQIYLSWTRLLKAFSVSMAAMLGFKNNTTWVARVKKKALKKIPKKRFLPIKFIQITTDYHCTERSVQDPALCRRFAAGHHLCSGADENQKSY